MVSSPAPQRRKAANRSGDGNDGDDYANDDSVASDDEDAFEPLPARRHRREETPGDGLGPPITIDQRMANLPDIHRVVVGQFVEEAKGLEEKIRNGTGARKPFFTEANFREMAINWTLTLDEMMQIPDINVERVKKYGPQFVKMVTNYHKDYDQMMADGDDRVIDKNHQNVIDLISDEEEYDLEDGEEDAILQAEQGSKYFANTKYGSNSNSGDASGRKFPWPAGSGTQSSASQKSSRGGGGSYRGKTSRGGKRSFSRKSNGSASGQSSSGVSKRKFSGGAKKSRVGKADGSNPSKGSTLMRQFGNHGSGGMGGGIGMMPT
jgi:bloom syndrome protein